MAMTNLAALVPPNELTAALCYEKNVDEEVAKLLVEQYGPGLFEGLDEQCALVALAVLWAIETILARRLHLAA